MIIKGVFKDADSNVLHVRTHAKNIIDENTNTSVETILNNIIANINTPKDLLLTPNPTQVGILIYDEETDIYTCTLYGIPAISMDNDTWYEFYDLSNIEIDTIVSMDGIIYATSTCLVPISMYKDIRLLFNNKTKKLYVMTTDKRANSTASFGIILRFIKENIFENKPNIIVNTPIITTPSNNSIVDVSDGTLTVTASEFTLDNTEYEDTFIQSEWKLTRDIEGTDIIKSDIDEGITSHTFDVDLDDSETVYIWVKYTGEQYGESEWSDSVAIVTSVIQEEDNNSEV